MKIVPLKMGSLVTLEDGRQVKLCRETEASWDESVKTTDDNDDSIGHLQDFYSKWKYGDGITAEGEAFHAHSQHNDPDLSHFGSNNPDAIVVNYFATPHGTLTPTNSDNNPQVIPDWETMLDHIRSEVRSERLTGIMLIYDKPKESANVDGVSTTIDGQVYKNGILVGEEGRKESLVPGATLSPPANLGADDARSPVQTQEPTVPVPPLKAEEKKEFGGW